MVNADVTLLDRLKNINVILKDNRINTNYKTILNKNKKVKELLFNSTTFIENTNDTSIKERLYCIINNIVSIPLCPVCNVMITFNNRNYNTYCSLQCSGKSVKRLTNIKKTSLNKYGTINPAQSEIIKNKIKLSKKHNKTKTIEIKEKIKKTNLERYGVENPFQSEIVKKKIRKTNLERYGVENPSQSEAIKNKKVKTNRKLYNCDHPAQNPTIKEKTKETNLKNYGTTSPLKNRNIINKLKETNLKNYNVESFSQKDIPLSILERLQNKKWLKQQHHTNKKSLKQISNELNISESTIGRYFKKFSISIITQPRSIEEKEIENFITSIGYKTLHTNKLDIIIPEKKIAIEYGSLYYHSEKNTTNKQGRNKYFHINKLIHCKNKDYRLLTIFSDEYLYQKDIVENRIKHILNSNMENYVYARQCNIKEISKNLSSLFLKKHHLQKAGCSSIRLGALYKNNIVAVMTFSRPSIAKGARNQDFWELNRFCIHTNYHIPGVASKLLTYFERNFEWHTIISYADRRWSEGNLYYKLGFNLVGETPPNYWYLEPNNYRKRIHRFALRKKPDEPKDITEWQLRQEQGYDRIWDCGSLKFIKIKETIPLL